MILPGGNAVLLYASVYHDVHIVINISGRFALERGIEGRLGKDFMQRIEKDGFIDVKDKTGNGAVVGNRASGASRRRGEGHESGSVRARLVYTYNGLGNGVVVGNRASGASRRRGEGHEFGSVRARLVYTCNGLGNRTSVVGNMDSRIGNFEYRVTEDSLKDRLETDMCIACHSIDKKCRVLTVHGSKDQTVPAEDAMQFAKLIPNHKLHIMEGANHCYTAHLEELASVVLDFMKSSQVFKGLTQQVMPSNFRLQPCYAGLSFTGLSSFSPGQLFSLAMAVVQAGYAIAHAHLMSDEILYPIGGFLLSVLLLCPSSPLPVPLSSLQQSGDLVSSSDSGYWDPTTTLLGTDFIDLSGCKLTEEGYDHVSLVSGFLLSMLLLCPSSPLPVPLSSLQQSGDLVALPVMFSEGLQLEGGFSGGFSRFPVATLAIGIRQQCYWGLTSLTYLVVN
ncbi:hypothetical protein ZIOFF_003677 [Zingiber officinale]|uniref:Peptidase S9 prolyl oligopeptidase catalytic domain-containing protein n=1 Tax=Zingiber officinale TaxID=94328 RepID=A0A8J5IU41_ZINOF|nr:hypothetical protein ZIOFF_003677 [Zingiber officinale]